MTPEPKPAEPATEGTPAGRLLVLALVVGAWAVITVGIAFERAEVTGGYQTLSLVVALLISRYFGLPARALTGAR